MSYPIDVCLTADVEFCINGSLTFPESRSPAGSIHVYRYADGKSEGLEAMLAPLTEFNLPATFFVEVLQQHYFGSVPMAEIVTRLRSLPGNDIQMHLHPCWRYFKNPDWRETVKTTPRNDSMAGRGDEAEEIIKEGAELFQHLIGQWPIALRTGGLHLDRRVLQAQEKLGIPLSSSVGIGVYLPPDRSLFLFGGVAHFGSVSELPVLSYYLPTIGGKRTRLFSLTGTSFRLAREILLWASKVGLSPVVILTHAHEFADEIGSPSGLTYRANRTNQQNWRQLCDFLAASPDKFKVTTFQEIHQKGLPSANVEAPAFMAGISEYARRAWSLIARR